MNKVEWISPQYIHTEKTNDWYWIVGIITISISLIAIILNNVVFGILILISGFTLSLFASRKPENVKVTLDELGVKVGDVYRPYKNIESFFIETKDHYPRILIKTDRYLSPLIKILIPIEKETDIENILSKHIEKEDLSESIFEKLLIYFGF